MDYEDLNEDHAEDEPLTGNALIGNLAMEMMDGIANTDGELVYLGSIGLLKVENGYNICIYFNTRDIPTQTVMLAEAVKRIGTNE